MITTFFVQGMDQKNTLTQKETHIFELKVYKFYVFQGLFIMLNQIKFLN